MAHWIKTGSHPDFIVAMCSDVECENRKGCHLYGRASASTFKPDIHIVEVPMADMGYERHWQNHRGFQIKCNSFKRTKRHRKTCSKCHLMLSIEKFEPGHKRCKACEVKYGN